MGECANIGIEWGGNGLSDAFATLVMEMMPSGCKLT